MNSESELPSSSGVEVEVQLLALPDNSYDVHLQLWGLHKDLMILDLLHGFRNTTSSSDNLTNSDPIDFGEILFFSIDSSDGTVYPRIDGCYWFEARISLQSSPYRNNI